MVSADDDERSSEAYTWALYTQVLCGILLYNQSTELFLSIFIATDVPQLLIHLTRLLNSCYILLVLIARSSVRNAYLVDSGLYAVN